MKRELTTTKRQTHKGIISNFNFKSKIAFIIIGLEHIEIMEKLENDYLILDSIEVLKSLKCDDISHIQKNLLSSRAYFITMNNDDFIGALQLYKTYFQKIFKRISLIDLEVLKAVEIISADELERNDYQIGLELPYNCSFKAYIDEVIKEDRYKPYDLYEYLKAVLENEIKRQELNIKEDK